ncbi:MAG: hypothetical protein SVS85_04265 [Candidatus Nanohaloarchaea archaeon]|nr:hypothetical protein [Candidatus Nanohaloarchaea archaeon]
MRTTSLGQTSLVGTAIGIMVATIVIGQVAIPIVQDAVSNVSGTAGTVLGYVALALAITLFVAALRPVIARM